MGEDRLNREDAELIEDRAPLAGEGRPDFRTRPGSDAPQDAEDRGANRHLPGALDPDHGPLAAASRIGDVASTGFRRVTASGEAEPDAASGIPAPVSVIDPSGADAAMETGLQSGTGSAATAGAGLSAQGGPADFAWIPSAIDSGGSAAPSGYAPSPGQAVTPQLVAPTGDASIDGILWGWKWGDTNLTYRFPTSANEYAPPFIGGPGYVSLSGFLPMTNTQASLLVNYGFGNLMTFSGVNLSPDNNFGGGNFRFAQAALLQYEAGHALTPNLHVPGGGSAEANPPSPFEIPASAMGDAWFKVGDYDNAQLGNFNWAGGLLHEFGHALGLKHGHTSQTRVDGTANPITLPMLPASENSQEYSVMTYASYVGHDIQGVGISELEEYPWTFMINDIAAIQYMYGANYGPGSNNGDTTYSFDPTTGAMTIDSNTTVGSYHAKILLTVWDGGGEDTYDFHNYNNDQTVNLGAGKWSTFSQAQLSNLSLGQSDGANVLARGNIANALMFQGDRRSLIENAITGNGDDTLRGNVVANTLDGRGGNDTINGLAGNDLLRGRGGDDNLFGGDDSDRLFGYAGKDRLSGDDGVDRLFGGDDFDILFGGNGRDTANGEGGKDRIYGQGGADLLSGGAEKDTLFGGAGGDTLQGGDGNDILDGGADGDRLFGDAGNDRLDGGDGVDRLNGGTGFDRLFGGDSVDFAFAGSGNDTVDGGKGGDKLFGQAGNDVLIGGRGGDEMTGGANADRFVIATGDAGIGGGMADRITDFRRADGDKVDLSGIDGNSAMGGVQALSWIGKDAAFTGAGQVRYQTANGYLEVNTDADAAAEMRIVVGLTSFGLPDVIL